MTSEELLSISGANWAAEVGKATVPVLVEFGAAWCPPCRMLTPVLAELAGEYGSAVKFGTVDADTEQALASEYGIMGLPTMLLFKQGELVDRIVGFTPKKELKSRIDGHLA